jgi:hypothetical protein
MIESRLNDQGLIYNKITDNYTFSCKETSLISDLSTQYIHGPNYVTLASNDCTNSTLYNNENYEFYQLEQEEETRKADDDNVSIKTIINHSDAENIALKHNTSPISRYYEQDTLLNTSETTTIAYLHSTELSSQEKCPQECLQCFVNFSHLTDSTHSTFSSPVATSTSFDSDSMYLLETSCTESVQQRDEFDSLLDMFSSTFEPNSHPDETYVCTKDYDAKFIGDVSVFFADTIQILRDSQEEWLYVKVGTDGREGYVPKTIVMDLKQFVQQLVKVKSSLINDLF